MAANGSPAPAAGDVVSAAHSLLPLIRAQRGAAEQLRHLPPILAEALRGAGLLQMYLPHAMGGPELPPLTVFRAIEALSRADGSTGWCAMIASSLSAFMGWIATEPGRAMAGAPADFRGAGSVRPQGRAMPVEGGYRVTGRWDFTSGVHHANWVLCSCIVSDDGHASPAPRQGLGLWVPAEAGTIHDTWSVVGMRGTGSHDFVVQDVFVPGAHSFALGGTPQQAGPQYQPRFVMIALWTATAANALGVARGAIDTFTEMAGHAATTMSASLLRDRPLVQTRIAEAEAIVNAARAYVIDAVGTAWDAMRSGASDPSMAIAQARLAIVHAMHEAVRATDLVFHAAGTTAVYTRNPLERYFRDVHVAVQHAAGLPVHYESAGKVLLGLRPSDPGW